jgi:hypothetical protein
MRTPRRLLGLVTSAVLGSAGPGCARTTPFSEGRYPEAMAEFESAESPPAGKSLPTEANYALYRGLGYLALGDAPRALPWLRACREMVRRDPRLLAPPERGALLSAWRTMAQMPGD